MNITEYLTYKEAAALTDYSPEGIRNLAQRGKLPYVKVGHNRLLRRQDVLALRPRDPRGRPRKSAVEKVTLAP